MPHDLDELFPVPSLPPSLLAPQRLPGVDLESLAVVQEALKDNHQRYHVFFNHQGFHNHVIHRTLAIYALGGSAAVIRDYYNRDGEIQRPAFQSPEPITEANFVEHLGDENFYQAYLSFFSEQVSEKGAARTLEEFFFSEKYNIQEEGHVNTRPEMLARFLTGVLHPLIHVGYGAEFGLKGTVVEGLAMAAVDNLDGKKSYPSAFFKTDLPDNSGTNYLETRLSSLALEVSPTTGARLASRNGGVHAFDIAARILRDEKLNRTSATDFIHRFTEKHAEYTPILREHVEKWTIDLGQPGEVERKMEEVIWLSSLIYGVGGLTPSGFQSDFLLMHLVTSSLFLPSLIAYLSPRSQVLLLRGYLFTIIVWWLMRGRPALNIKSFMTTTSVQPSVPTTPTPKDPATTETTPIPNPFLLVLQSAITHPIEHLVKTQRAFAHFDTLYGTRPAGYFKGTELEGAELLDGSIFLRAALLTADHVGWVREGEEVRPFSFEGFYTFTA